MENLELSPDKSEILKTLEAEQEELENQLENLKDEFGMNTEQEAQQKWLKANLDRSLEIKSRLAITGDKIADAKKELGIEETEKDEPKTETKAEKKEPQIEDVEAPYIKIEEEIEEMGEEDVKKEIEKVNEYLREINPGNLGLRNWSEEFIEYADYLYQLKNKENGVEKTDVSEKDMTGQKKVQDTQPEIQSQSEPKTGEPTETKVTEEPIETKKEPNNTQKTIDTLKKYQSRIDNVILRFQQTLTIDSERLSSIANSSSMKKIKDSLEKFEDLTEEQRETLRRCNLASLFVMLSTFNAGTAISAKTYLEKDKDLKKMFELHNEASKALTTQFELYLKVKKEQESPMMSQALKDFVTAIKNKIVAFIGGGHGAEKYIKNSIDTIKTLRKEKIIPKGEWNEFSDKLDEVKNKEDLEETIKFLRTKTFDKEIDEGFDEKTKETLKKILLMINTGAEHEGFQWYISALKDNGPENNKDFMSNLEADRGIVETLPEGSILIKDTLNKLFDKIEKMNRRTNIEDGDQIVGVMGDTLKETGFKEMAESDISNKQSVEKFYEILNKIAPDNPDGLDEIFAFLEKNKDQIDKEEKTRGKIDNILLTIKHYKENLKSADGREENKEKIAINREHINDFAPEPLIEHIGKLLDKIEEINNAVEVKKSIGMSMRELPGHKVIVRQEWGTEQDQEKIKKYLKFGETYIVEKTSTSFSRGRSGSKSSAGVFLKGVGDVEFNPVCFKGVEK